VIYKRVLLKLSGEALLGERSYGIDPKRIAQYAKDIKTITDLGIEVAVVIGGGNIFRGVSAASNGIDRVQGDYMGMLATVINGMALQSSLEEVCVQTRLQTAIKIEAVAEPYIKRKAVRHLEKKRVVIFGGGTGNPFFTTDSAAVLRAIEINADVILKGTRVDGVYDSDPEKNKKAKKYDTISFSDVLSKNLKVMDSTAFTLSQENNLPIIVFNMNERGKLIKSHKRERNRNKNKKLVVEEIEFIIESCEESMTNAIKHLEKELLNIRAGKANPSMLSSVKVDYYGATTPLSQIANINTPDSQTLSVQPWEKDKLQDIEKAIMVANLGFNPMNNGESILINIPPLTEERRKELVKIAKSEIEIAKVSVRNARKDANNEIKKIDVSTDQKAISEEDVQSLTNKYVSKIDAIFASKEKEILSV